MKIILIRQAEAGGIPADTSKGNAAAYAIYISTACASRETAEALFTFSAPPTETALLDDVPQSGSGLRGWLDMRREAKHRSGQFLDMLESKGRDSIVICGRQAMSALMNRLRAKGYLLEGGGLLPRPLERVRATKRFLHCGGCAHNCLLSEAKCQKGQNKYKGIL